MDGLLQVLVSIDLDRDIHSNRQISPLIYLRVLRVNQIVLRRTDLAARGIVHRFALQRDRQRN